MVICNDARDCNLDFCQHKKPHDKREDCPGRCWVVRKDGLSKCIDIKDDLYVEVYKNGFYKED